MARKTNLYLYMIDTGILRQEEKRREEKRTASTGLLVYRTGLLQWQSFVTTSSADKIFNRPGVAGAVLQ